MWHTTVPMLARQKFSSMMWFRDDLRITDNLALHHARSVGDTAAVYVVESPSPGVRKLGAAASWWLHHSLVSLQASLLELGIPLVIASGNAVDIIPRLAASLQVTTVAWSRRYHKPQAVIDDTVATLLAKQEITSSSFPGALLAEPWEIVTKTASPYRVYTPFATNLQGFLHDQPVAEIPPVPANRKVRLDAEIAQLLRASIDDAALLPSHPSRNEPDWAADFSNVWTPGEPAAWHKWDAFSPTLETAAGRYASERDFPAVAATSGLSPHIRFGEISIRTLYDAALECGDNDNVSRFCAELMWRDFAWNRLYHLPNLATENSRREFDNFPWRSTPDKDFALWCEGNTGFALVDAGMRELRSTGFMHNRVRMVTASLLTKNLGFDWRLGEQWFWDQLVDADPASNPFNWQWVAGCGDDAAPYFRIFNPHTQAKRFDPTNEYITRWVPEYPTMVYPEPMVDAGETRQLALAAYQQIKTNQS